MVLATLNSSVDKVEEERVFGGVNEVGREDLLIKDTVEARSVFGYA